MRKFSIVTLSLLTILGCATLQETTPKEPPPLRPDLVVVPDDKVVVQKQEPQNAPVSGELQNIKNEDLGVYAEQKGVIFAKPFP